MIDFIKETASLISAMILILGALVTIEKKSRGAITHWLLRPILEKTKMLEDRIKTVEMDNLKIIIMSENIPIDERLHAGERYTQLGGNSTIRINYKLLKEQYEKNMRR